MSRVDASDILFTYENDISQLEPNQAYTLLEL